MRTDQGGTNYTSGSRTKPCRRRFLKLPIGSDSSANIEETGPPRTQSRPLCPPSDYRFAVFGNQRNIRITAFSVPNGKNHHFLHRSGSVRSNRREVGTKVYGDPVNTRREVGDCQSIRQEVAIPELLGWPPKRCGSYCFDYKCSHSVVLIAVAGLNYECLYVDVGTNVRISDGGVLGKSAFLQQN